MKILKTKNAVVAIALLATGAAATAASAQSFTRPADVDVRAVAPEYVQVAPPARYGRSAATGRSNYMALAPGYRGAR